MTLNQLALNTGSLAPAVATSMAFDPITSVVLGVTLLDESLRTTAVEGVGTGARAGRGAGRDGDPGAVAGQAESPSPAAPTLRGSDHAWWSSLGP